MTTGNFKIITVESTKRMKSNAIVGSIGRFDNEIELVERHDQHYGIHEEDEEQCHCRKHWRFDNEIIFVELVRDGYQGPASVPSHQSQRLLDEIKVRQCLPLPALAS